MLRGRIIGTGSKAPKRVLSNSDLEKIVETSNEWIIRRTGIKERRISLNGGGEGTTDLASEAARRALEMAEVDPESLDMIVVGTVTPDRQVPSAACLVQQRLGALNAAAFDLSAGCSGFLYALATADNAIRVGNCRKALVIGVDRLSTILNWKDRGTCVLLGDGAGAVILSASEGDGGILSSHLKSDGRHWELLYSEEGNTYLPEMLTGLDQKSFYLKMDGNDLFKKAVNKLSEIAREALAKNDLTSQDISLLVPHQANMRIIQAMGKQLGISMDKVYTNLERYGNTSSASIPIALDEANRQGRIKRGDYLMLLAFGAGLTWAGSILKWSI